MKNKLMPMADKILLRKRALIETVNDQLKNISQVEHTRHRSISGFMLNLLGALVAYTYQRKNRLFTWKRQSLKRYPLSSENKCLFIKK